MREIIWLSSFKKDFKLAEKRGKNTEKLAHIISQLSSGKTLPAKNRNHKLKGVYADC
jgi:mRNA interferase YafQ